MLLGRAVVSFLQIPMKREMTQLFVILNEVQIICKTRDLVNFEINLEKSHYFQN